MFEVILTFLFLLLIFFIASVVLKLLLIFICILIIATGIYATFSGAPYLPTKKRQIEAMKKLAAFTKRDIVYDLGCGDGRIVRAVSKIGVRNVIGYEFSFLTYVVARFLGGDIRFGNFWFRDFSDATVIICFLLPGSMERFGKEIWPTLKKGTRVLSNAFPIKGISHVDNIDGVYFYVKK